MAHFDENPLGPHLPLDPLPGHSSLGRLERVLRRGEFAVTTELNPPDSANPDCLSLSLTSSQMAARRRLDSTSSSMLPR